MIVALPGWHAELDIEIAGAKAQEPQAQHTVHEDVIALPPGLQVWSGKGFAALAEALAPSDQPWREFPVGEPVAEEDGEQPGQQQDGREQHVEGLVHVNQQERKIAEQPVPSLQDLY